MELKLKAKREAIGRWLNKVFMCKIMGAHDWTCAAAEGIPPTTQQLTTGVAGFFDYAKTYCRRCPAENQSSAEVRAKNPMPEDGSHG